MNPFLFVLVFVSAIALDYAYVRYIMAVEHRDAMKAAAWGIAQWCAGLVGFFVAVKVSLWALPAEAAGLALGTWLSVKRQARDFPKAVVISEKKS